jgi:septal ring factor EnvC (AmiA/AmiB activator)
MRPLFLPIIIAACVLAGSAAPAVAPLSQAEADYREAQRRAEALDRLAASQQGELDRLRAEQRAAVQALEAGEARITLATLQEAAATMRAADARSRLAEAQRPASLLLAGLATMARRPPLLALANSGDADTLVRTRLLLDATMPEIRRRSSTLERGVERAAAALAAARAAHRELIAGRAALADRKLKLLGLEQQLARQVLKAGDDAFAATDTVEALGSDLASDRAAAAMAADLAKTDPLRSFARPPQLRPDGPRGYRLPADAPVSEGLGSVDRNGVRARGLTLATAAGAPIAAPAAGIVRFSGPLGDINGIVLIDHGGGWISVVTNVATPLAKGARVEAGETIGRALGPIGIELSRGGKRHSPALIAGSSGALSNAGKRG